MKNYLLTVTVIAAVMMMSCNNNRSSGTSGTDHSMMNHDEMPMNDTKGGDKEVRMMSATFSHMDPGVSSYMKSMMQQYLGIKNALVDGKDKEAAGAAGKMVDMMKGFDKSLLTTEQKKVYDDIEDDLKENAEHISKSALDHQRDHFSMMSEDMYDMVKAFGAGMTIYHDHCPMARDNQGAMWLSESKDIRNPYFGDKMMNCGSVEEMFQ